MNALFPESLADASRVLILHEGENPTSDFYLASRLNTVKVDVEWLRLDALPDPERLNGAALVIVRYLNPSWHRFLSLHHHRLADCVWLIDDDLFDFQVLWKVSGGLGWKWFWRAWRYKAWLDKQVKLWVSTPYLADKYAKYQPHILPPQSPYQCVPAPSTLSTADSGRIAKPIVFYHGSISHRREQAWLIPVFEQVVQQYPDVEFELIGNQKVSRLFAHISQVKVYPALSWPEYKVWLQKPGRKIGLAPLLEDSVNAARAPTRFYDIEASGAVGIYSPGPVYESVVIDGINGHLVETDQAQWVNKILELLNQSSRDRGRSNISS